MTNEEFRAIALLAYKSVESPTYDDFIRVVQRWFSKSFSVPLPEVEEMADEYLLRHYYEDTYNEMSKDKSDEGAQAFAQIRERLLGSFKSEKTILDEVEEEEDFWQESLEEEFARDNPELAKKAEPAETNAESPNLSNCVRSERDVHEEHRDIHIQADDPIPDF